jgi:hypothetical protein
MSFFGKFKTGAVSWKSSWSCFALGQTVAAHIGRQQLTGDRIFADTERFGRTTTPKEGP